ncbi:ABC-2 type transport system permease protein [Gracilibacillus orientalis]|uniref:ABC-2 type transport system permease protein n=1 Tax=Gracilibacillus orientalis TaxID=334253 RepID=A0A1I4HEW2_9BACI|nr:ABC transporter permease [Gracilibacillus orientalis]SFL40223.1 ABC-2 type transport system permease protein [Gracilibacillus orientalis]
MLNAHRLFVERLAAHMKELSRYLRYIITGHIVIAMMFIVSAMSVYYQQFLEDIPDYFPSAWVIAIVLGVVTAHSPIQTLLKRADIVFLIPAEPQLSGYFVRALFYSFVTQLYLFVLAMAAVAPLYMAVFPGNSTYGLLFVVLFIIKGWSLVANWWMLRVRDKNIRVMDKMVRFSLIVTLVYFFLVQELIFLAVITVLLIVLFATNYQTARKHKALNWDLLIESDYLRMRSFYRLANMFTDVPHMETQIKKRHWLARLLTGSIPFQQKQTYPYMYRLTTVRSGEYLGIYVRLLIIGGLLIYFVPNPWLKLIFALLFMYMIFLQVIPLWKHHATLVWLDLYPIANQVREQAFIKWMQQLIMFVGVLLVLFLFVIGEWLMGLIMAIAALLFIVIVIPNYLNKKIYQ